MPRSATSFAHFEADLENSTSEVTEQFRLQEIFQLGPMLYTNDIQSRIGYQQEDYSGLERDGV